PWRLLGSNAAASVAGQGASGSIAATVQPLSPTPGSPAMLLRPLLGDLLQQESYLEIRQASNQPGQLALAGRLDPTQGFVWQTSLAAVLESLSGTRPVASAQGWKETLSAHSTPLNGVFQLRRVGDWTILGWTMRENPLLEDFASRIQRDQSPFAADSTNEWL